MTRRYWSGDDTPTDLRLAAPECATPDPDPIDSWSWASLIVGIVFSGAGLIGMVYGAVQFLAR